jgi:CTP synthase (UTP-ammonia lyase)
MGIRDADSAEHGSDSKNIIITPVACAMPNRAEGAPKLSGEGMIRIEPQTGLSSIYDRSEVHEEYFCNYEVNPEFEKALPQSGLRVSGRGPQGEIRAVELRGNRFFIAVLYQPQRSSTPARPHPVVSAFIEATAGFHESRGG